MQKYYINGQLNMRSVFSFNLTDNLASDIKITTGMQDFLKAFNTKQLFSFTLRQLDIFISFSCFEFLIKTHILSIGAYRYQQEKIKCNKSV